MKTIIDNFVDRVIEYGMYNEIDKIYVKNRVLALIGEEGTDRISDENDLKQIKDYLVEIALKNGKIKDLIEEKECLGAELMNFIVPLPSRLNDIFWSSYDISSQEAVEEFYKLSKDSDYIKTSAIAKNIEFRSSTKYGELEITINLSKPEKDPKTIAAEKLVKAGFKDVSDAKGVKEYKDYELVKFTTLLADQFQAAIDKKEGTFIDVREAKDFEKGHVAGAKNIDVKNIDKDLAALLPADKNAPVYTYCYSGNRSAKAAQKAVELGYTNVYNAWDGAKEHEYKF